MSVRTSIVCLWEYVKPPEKEKYDPRRLWQLKETVPVDGDGEPIYRENTDYHDWLNQDDDGELVPIPGRAATCWSVQSGVTLLGLTLPEHVTWLDRDFVKRLKELPNWYELLQCGHNLYMGTARAVEDYLDE